MTNTLTRQETSEFEELRERAFRAGANAVAIGITYYGRNRDARYHIIVESNGWERTYYGKTTSEVFRSLGVFLDERGY